VAANFGGRTLGGLSCIAPAPAIGIPIDTDGGRHRILPVVMDGGPGKLILDAGAQQTILSRAGLTRLGLRLDRWVGTSLQGAGGADLFNALAMAVRIPTQGGH